MSQSQSQSAHEAQSASEAQSQPEGFRQHRFVLPEGATRVLLIRHGESAAARRGERFPLVDGHADPALHPHGELQAERLGERFGAEPWASEIAAIYVTTLRRTHQTAAPLAARLGLEPRVIADLREVFLGDWEGGELRWRAADRDPIFLQVLEQRRWDVIPGSEPQEVFHERLQRGLTNVAAAHPNECVAVVVHGGVIGQILGAASNSDAFVFSGADNASVSELIVHGNHRTIRRFNDTAHLEGL